MEQVETDVGRRLVWAAVNHHNTANPHVHIVVRGWIADGDDVRINGRYIAEGMRWRAQEMADARARPAVGAGDGAKAQSKEISRAGFTAIDRMLAGHASADGRLAAERLATAPRPERAACLARLAVLEKMQLARPEPAGAWRLADDWEPTPAAVRDGRRGAGAPGTSHPGSRGRGAWSCSLASASRRSKGWSAGSGCTTSWPERCTRR